MNWLIVEDALRDRKGHWFEYVQTFWMELRRMGDQVTLLVDKNADFFIRNELHALPTLPQSIWHRMGDGAGALKRHWRVPAHAWQTYRALVRYFKTNQSIDIIFVPTVLVHHLLGWYCLIKRHKSPAPVLLFFPNLPIQLSDQKVPTWNPSPTTRLMRWLLERLRPEVEQNRVILGVETQAMKNALATLTNLPITYFPHPVASSPEHRDSRPATHPPTTLTMACYGPARFEKGSDVLAHAIKLFLELHPESRVRFILQWLEDFQTDTGEWARLEESLKNHPKVEIVSRYFQNGEYAEHLKRADVMLLPYRRSSYGLRVSRVVIEAVTTGIPVVVSSGTTLHEQAAQFGGWVACEDGDVASLVKAIAQMESGFNNKLEEARHRQQYSRDHFSVESFRSLLAHPKANRYDSRWKSDETIAVT